MKILIIQLVISFMCLNLGAQSFSGLATYYDDKFEGRPTANGEIFSQNKFTASHNNLPFGTKIRVTNIENKKSVIVRINDRGPFVGERILDLSKSAAKELGYLVQGIAHVSAEILKSDEKSDSVPDSVSFPHNNAVHFPNEYYEIDIKFARPEGFAVQVGSFTELSNLMRMAQELERSNGKNLLVQISDVHEKKVHRLFVGPLPDRTSAEKLQGSLKSSFPACFVVSLQK